MEVNDVNASTTEQNETKPAVQAGTPPNQGESDDISFTPEQQKVIDKRIAEARDKGRTMAEQAAADKDRERQAEAEREAEKAKGNFAKVEADLTAERDGFKAERDTLAGKVDRYEALTKTRVDAIKGELPAEATEDFPAEADAIDQLEWLDGRQKLLAKLAPAVANGSGHPRVPATPQAQGQPKQEATSLVSRHAI